MELPEPVKAVVAECRSADSQSTFMVSCIAPTNRFIIQTSAENTTGNIYHGLTDHKDSGLGYGLRAMMSLALLPSTRQVACV